MARTPYVDADVCIGCGVCVSMVPEVFQMTPEDKAEVFEPAGAPENVIQQAMDSCPVSCIYWR